MFVANISKIFLPDFKQVTQIFHLICFSTDSISTKEETHHSNKFIWFFSLSFVNIHLNKAKTFNSNEFHHFAKREDVYQLATSQPYYNETFNTTTILN